MSICFNSFDCAGFLVCCNSYCTSSSLLCNDNTFGTVQSTINLGVGIIAAISIGGIVFCAGLIGLCVFLCTRSSRSRAVAVPAGGTTVVTTTAGQNMATYPTSPQNYPPSNAPGTVYPQTNISTQPPAYGIPQPEPIATSAAGPPPYQNTSDPYYNKQPF